MVFRPQRGRVTSPRFEEPWVLEERKRQPEHFQWNIGTNGFSRGNSDATPLGLIVFCGSGSQGSSTLGYLSQPLRG